MNQLYWKEWREQRMVMAAMPLVSLALLAGIALGKSLGVLGEDRTPTLGNSTLVGCLVFCSLMSAAICGSQIMAPEVNIGTLRFLNILPVSRSMLWRGKVLAGLCATFVSVLGSSLISLVVYALLRQGKDVIDVLGLALSGASGNGSRIIVSLLLLAGLVYSIGCYATMLLEKTINAILVTVAASVGIFALIGFAVAKVQTDYGDPYRQFAISDWMFALFSLVFLAISLRTFELGETLQTSQRFSILLWPRWIGNIALTFTALLIAYLWIMR